MLKEWIYFKNISPPLNEAYKSGCCAVGKLSLAGYIELSKSEDEIDACEDAWL